MPSSTYVCGNVLGTCNTILQTVLWEQYNNLEKKSAICPILQLDCKLLFQNIHGDGIEVHVNESNGIAVYEALNVHLKEPCQHRKGVYTQPVPSEQG